MFGYLMRHWRGELSLAVAWWINGVALTLGLLALSFNAQHLGIAPLLTTRTGFAVYCMAGLALFLLVPAWQVIGIFRTADRHAIEVGTLLATRLTQSLATLLTVLLATHFLMFAGEARSGLRLAWPPGGPSYTVAISHDGRMLEIRGSFTFGLAEDARRLLDANPQVRRVRLNSGGGLLGEAQRVRTLIVERGLDTDSTTVCASACVSAYLGGAHRLLHASARLGFHLPRNPGFGLRGRVSPEYAAELREFARRGVPRWFIDRWVASGRQFWYPDPRQLRMSGLVHGYFGRPRPGEEAWFR
ncbi:MAG: hypothetical protein IT486_08250 [Gammaproteobacteria bacterium]|nr:hypothetical protein [Gammaproteobacteria bacterium]